MIRATIVLGLVLVGAACALAKEPPRWTVGDTWTVRTFQREVALVPSSARGPRIPGAPPLRKGVPEGWKHANRWKLTVTRVDGEKATILLEALEGPEKRQAELGFEKGVLVRIGERVLVKRTNLKESRELCFPLDWPESFAAWKPGDKWWTTFECAGVRGVLERRPPGSPLRSGK